MIKALLVRIDITLHFLKKKVYFIITMRHYN